MNVYRFESAETDVPAHIVASSAVSACLKWRSYLHVELGLGAEISDSIEPDAIILVARDVIR